MNSKWGLIGEQGLQFFGKMSATISHEINNALAIINENAGLLQDFILMAEKGMPLDPERLNSLAGKVIQQIRRAEGIIKNMNMFAHSVDESVKSINLSDVVELMTALSCRFASMRGVTVEPKPAALPVTITTNPFFLENLIWLCLDFAMDAAGAGNTIDIVSVKTETGAQVRFAQVEDLAKAPLDKFPSERGKALLDTLKADLVSDAGAGEIVITLPRNIDI
ncbi:MAG: sensor histidine kinase [Deltaproteobacteria bacterium]|nr:sensor histidine kinase [Deltaproteobacteria bacterium]MBW2117757.1 sensor histidine kinase [Deltaproteobacteria bacterium]